jgi:hypothetical protein
MILYTPSLPFLGSVAVLSKILHQQWPCAPGNFCDMVCYCVTPACRFAHDAVATGRHAFIASTGDGVVLELQLSSLEVIKRHHPFTPAEHLNALAPTGNDSMWCLLHNHGKVTVLPARMQHLSCNT